MHSFGERLRRLRKNKDLSQEDVAITLGYSRVQVSNWEIERSEPDLETLNKLARFFGVTIDYLTCRADNTEELVPSSNSLLDSSTTYLNKPALDEILHNLQQMSLDEIEIFRRLTWSVVNRTTKGIS